MGTLHRGSHTLSVGADLGGRVTNVGRVVESWFLIYEMLQGSVSLQQTGRGPSNEVEYSLVLMKNIKFPLVV